MPSTLLLAALALTACTGDAGPPLVERTDSAGVEQVLNRSPEVALDWSFEEEWRVGPTDSGPEALFGVPEAGVAADGDGNVLILDGGNYRVSAWSPTGRFLWAAGREGDGPGELAYPIALLVDEEGRAWIKDLAREFPVVFTPGGTRVDTTWALPRMSGSPRLVGSHVAYLTREAEDGQVTLSIRLTDDGDADEARPPVVQATVQIPGAFQLESCGIGFSGMQRIFDAGPRWDGNTGLLAAATGPGYRVDLFDADGVHLRTVSRDLPLRPATPELAEESLGEGFTVGTPGGERTCDPAEVVEKRGVAEHIPLVGRPILVGDELWVERYRVGEGPGAIDVFRLDGEYRGTLPAGSPVPAAVFPDGRIAALEENELGVQSVVVYRIRRGRD